MPHVEIKCYPGRTDEQKLECAKRIAQDIVETLGCDITHVSVAIKDVEKSDWKEQVYDKVLAEDGEYLYKKPEYEC